MASQVADHADNLESRLDQTRNVFDIGIILNRRKEKSQVIYYCIINRLTLFLFTAGTRFFTTESITAGNTRDNHKKHARIGDAYIREIGAKKRNGTRLRDVLTIEGDLKGGYPTLTLERGARSSNCWCAFSTPLGRDITFSLSFGGRRYRLPLCYCTVGRHRALYSFIPVQSTRSCKCAKAVEDVQFVFSLSRSNRQRRLRALGRCVGVALKWHETPLNTL
jgi:hypothetical protein